MFNTCYEVGIVPKCWVYRRGKIHVAFLLIGVELY